MLRLAMLLVLCGAADVHAARFSIQDYGATANDQSDDTVAVLKTLKACQALPEIPAMFNGLADAVSSSRTRITKIAWIQN